MNFKTALATFFTLALMTGAAAYAAQPEIQLCNGIVPAAAFPGLGKTLPQDGGITEQQFNEVLDRLQKAYEPEFAAHGATMDLIRDWKTDTQNAFSSRLGHKWSIHMYGGLARTRGMTRDGFAVVACHETGHQLGGRPHAIVGFQGLSSEGEADYFATLKCARRVFAGDDNAKVLAARNVDPFVRAECTAEFASSTDQDVCVRSAMAGHDLAEVLRGLGGDTGADISFTTPDQKDPIFISRQAHPEAQCRLDTYFNGARCPVSVDVPLSNDAYWPGTCDRQGQGPNTGSRPRCWFKPTIGFSVN